ncbi:MAG: 4Fe-4S binding protein [Spirochaetota bacterium]
MAGHTDFGERLRSSAPYLAIVVLGALALANRHAYLELRERDVEQPESVPSISQIQDVYPEVDSVDDCDEAGDLCDLLDDDGDRVASVLFSDPDAGEITGHGGPISLLIELDDEQEIARVDLLDHSETESFVDDIREERLLERWDGLSIEEALEENVDAVTGATLTSQAIIDSVHATLERYTGETTEAADGAPGTALLVRQILTVVFLIPGVVAAFSTKFRRRFQTAILLANVIVLGFVARSFLSLSILEGLILHGPDGTGNWHLLLVLVVFAVLSLATGTNVWCTQVCPYGSLQRLAGKLGKGMSVKLPGPMKKALRHSRPVVLCLAFIVAYGWPGFNLTQVEPFAAFLIVGVPVASVVIAVLFVLLSLFQPRVWCRSFCPTGMVLDTLRIRNRTVRSGDGAAHEPEPAKSPAGSR